MNKALCEEEMTSFPSPSISPSQPATFLPGAWSHQERLENSHQVDGEGTWAGGGEEAGSHEGPALPTEAKGPQPFTWSSQLPKEEVHLRAGGRGGRQ